MYGLWSMGLFIMNLLLIIVCALATFSFCKRVTPSELQQGGGGGGCCCSSSDRERLVDDDHTSSLAAVVDGSLTPRSSGVQSTSANAAVVDSARAERESELVASSFKDGV